MRREWEPDELIACWTLVEARGGHHLRAALLRGDPRASVAGASERLQELIAGDADGVVRVGGGRGLLSELKADPGRLGLETLLGEIAKLESAGRPCVGQTAHRS